MKKVILILAFVGAMQFAYSQEDSIWKPDLHITGYVNTIAEYVDLQSWKDAGKNVGIGLSEAAFLVSYKPLQRLEFKGTFVYSHFIKDIQTMLVEAYATYTIDPGFKISAGKYLTPLSPVNQYFYAPMNPAPSLPMLVSHHFLLPQSISGLQLSGEFGSQFKLGYNVTYGTYMTLGHPSSGILGIQGAEDRAIFTTDPYSATPQYYLGGSARIYCNYNDVLSFGVNYFDGRKSTQSVAELKNGVYNVFSADASKFSTGVDMQLKLNNLKINSEFWYGEQVTTKLDLPLNNHYYGLYGEMIYDIGAFSPFLRYDNVNDLKATVFNPYPTSVLYSFSGKTQAATVGFAFRPIYEILLKIEYQRVYTQPVYSDVNIPVAMQSVLPPSNPLGVTSNSYNYFVLSLVYSF